METGVYIISALLWLWFFGCVVTYRIGGVLLVEGMGLKSAEFLMLVLFSAGVAAFAAYRPVGQWVLFGVLLLWLAVQFFCHWYYTLFGATEKKLAGYNACFANTLRLFPASAARSIPDFYHIALHALILSDTLLLALYMLRGR